MAHGSPVSRPKWFGTAAVFAMVFGLTPQPAAADWILTPFVGWNFGGSGYINAGSSRDSTSSNFEPKIAYGASLAAMGNGAVGFEIDFGHSPRFFEDHTSGSGFRLSPDSSVTTLTGNVIVRAHGGPIRPYVVGGVALIRTNLHDADRRLSSSTSNNFGMDVGAGVMGFFAQNVGLRGDIRYFRSFRDNYAGLVLEDFSFWRGSVGVSFKF
jgi:opacity protein-like surface antigen